MGISAGEYAKGERPPHEVSVLRSRLHVMLLLFNSLQQQDKQSYQYKCIPDINYEARSQSKCIGSSYNEAQTKCAFVCHRVLLTLTGSQR